MEEMRAQGGEGWEHLMGRSNGVKGSKIKVREWEP